MLMPGETTCAVVLGAHDIVCVAGTGGSKYEDLTLLYHLSSFPLLLVSGSTGG